MADTAPDRDAPPERDVPAVEDDRDTPTVYRVFVNLDQRRLRGRWRLLLGAVAWGEQS
jgi:hypothetical protein